MCFFLLSYVADKRHMHKDMQQSGRILSSCQLNIAIIQAKTKHFKLNTNNFKCNFKGQVN